MCLKLILKEIWQVQQDFIDQYCVAHLGIGEIMFCAKVNDFEKMVAFMSNPAEVQRDKDYGWV